MLRASLAALLVLGGAWALAPVHGTRAAGFWLLGAALGVALFHASFSFAGAFRRLIAERRGAGLRAQMVMLALAILLMLPAIEAGSLFGAPVRGFVFPVGWALLLGAFLFGIGMQLGGGCGSGTLYTAGSGQGARMWITLAAFIAGATFAAFDAERWMGWPALPPISLRESLGLWPAIGLSLGIFALVFFAARAMERARHGGVEALAWRAPASALWRGGWPLLWGAVALALLNFATLWWAGRPWAITAAFPLWGSRLIDLAGWDDPGFWAYWEEPTRSEALFRPLWADSVTLMDLGLMAGAFLAAALAGRPADLRLPALRPALASLTGGLLLGYGAVLGFGCNISAYFGGIASGSLHGWVWIFPALLGNAAGIRLRPIFHLNTK